MGSRLDDIQLAQELLHRSFASGDGFAGHDEACAVILYFVDGTSCAFA
jgi:hypothetical protein